MLGILLLGRAPARAGYPTPREAGFHHCALIYDTPNRTEAAFAPYVSRPGGRDWLFDAFLFLVLRTPGGVQMDEGAPTKADWQYQLDRWFAPGRDLAALDAAIESAQKRLGPVGKRRVILSIPYLNPAVRDFGDVGRGHTEDLATAEGREAVMRWYVDEARRRFQAAGFRHLDLWGFYWLREEIGREDPPIIRQVAAKVHATGGKLLWIPYFRAVGWDQWRGTGIDVAILQPNLAWGTWQNGGAAARNRLGATAALAKAQGMGVEIEARNVVGRPDDQRVFLQYLADGGRFGYQQAATAYYLNEDSLEQMASSANPGARRAYDRLADYVSNRRVPDPDPKLAWTWTSEPSGARTAAARLSPARRVARLDVLLDEPGAPWQGTVQASVRTTDGKAWAPAGWVVRSGGDVTSGRHQVISIPVGQDAESLRVAFRPRPGSPALRATALLADPYDMPRLLTQRALGRPYRFTPAPAAMYPDAGGELADGVIPTGGFRAGGLVGWAHGPEVAVSFDLGRVRDVSRVEVYCEGGGESAVNFPARASALFSAGEVPPTTASGYGALPGGLTVVPGGPVVIDRRRSPVDADGHIVIAPPAPLRARYVTLLANARGWLMLSEVRIISGGHNIAPQVRYSLHPAPSGSDDAPGYSDDGQRLTDGSVAEGFQPGSLSGWNTGQTGEVVVDLGAARPVGAVTVWSLRGGGHGVYAPERASMEVSDDGATWRALGTAEKGPGVESGAGCIPAAYRVTAPPGTRARYVRARITPGRAWCMLSEVQVE